MTLDREEIRRRLDKFSNLQSMPQVILKVKQISEDQKASPADLANAILSDHQLTSRVLRMANSAHYGSFSGKINTVTRAIMLIGSRAVRNIAISMGVFQIVNNMSKASKFNLTAFWTRSLGCGIIAKHLAHRMKRLKLIEAAFIAGFMHDIGQAILATIFPDEYEEIARLEAETGSLEIHKTEKVILGINHVKAGEYVARKWKLPGSLVRAIADHHRLDMTPTRIRKSKELLVDLVYVSDRLFPLVMGGVPAVSESTDAVMRLSCDLLGITEEDLEDLPTICRKQINEIAQDLEIDILDEYGRTEALEKDVLEIRQQLSNKEVQLAFLQNATDALVEAKSEEETLQVVCEAIFRGLQMGRAVLFEHDAQWDSFCGKVGFGMGSQQEVQALKFSAKTGLFGHIRESGNYVSAVGGNRELYGSLIGPEEGNQLSLSSFAAIPIKVLDEVKYVVITDAHDRQTPISDEAVRSMMSLANQAAMSLERTLLRAQLKSVPAQT